MSACDTAVKPAAETGGPDSSPTSPSLKEDFDDVSGLSKRLTRGISRATDNVTLVSRARSELAQGLWRSGSDGREEALDTPVFTFTLPDFSIYPSDFREFLERDLIETSTLVSLESAGEKTQLVGGERHLSEAVAPCHFWGRQLSPARCLLGVVLGAGMWGFHDRLLTLRKALHSALSQRSDLFYRRWRWQTEKQHKEAGLELSEAEWESEWAGVVRMASTEPRPGRTGSGTGGAVAGGGRLRGADVYESLEEIHVLGLSHILRRPILVVADTLLRDAAGQPFAPIPFGGLYLPLEVPPAECHRSPLCLTYDAAHFSALVAMDNEGYVDKAPLLPAAVPLMGPDLKLLPLQFAVDPGPEVQWGGEQPPSLTEQDRLGLMKEYLDVIELPLPPESPTPTLPPPVPTPTPPPPPAVPARPSGRLHTVARHFSSLGRSMSKKIKKNFGHMVAKRTNSFKVGKLEKPQEDKKSATLPTAATRVEPPAPKKPVVLLAAVIHTEKRHEYQQDMIRNYLNSARSRFLRERESRQRPAAAPTVGPPQCVSPGCPQPGSASTGYLCSSCHAKQAAA
ncbi:hypothetical protein LAZ67_7000935 [Cordylochernes scorpioides]|uniref:ubiquitinyl hydrolase 1 n=1 Tax=Cordylochernes scorpioides TaxID=51811 RepID=A0ABY6KNQ8_9ARAC|nr:hypothetical protein LAZ67_7000935 [Cordylochernes scorpioides]